MATVPEPPYQVVKTYQDATFLNDGDVRHEVRVTFMVGKHGPFSERFAKAEFSREVVDRRLRPFALEVWALEA